jgi:O-antigen/teichoic acid export membrane protein
LKVYKQLAGQTAIYGISSIVGRFLNYLLVPLYTRVFDVAEYGIVTQLYAYVTFFNIVFTYGLETAFFRFFQSEKDKSRVFSTGLISILISSVAFAGAIFLFSDSISDYILKDHQSGSFYIKIFAGILALDAITALPFAKLRQENKAKRFVFIRVFNISINIGLNLFFLVACPMLINNGSATWLNEIYEPSFGIGYIFISGLISSAITFLMLAPEMFSIPLKFDAQLWKKMLVYAFPLMIAGFAGMINETFDRILIPFLIEDQDVAMHQVGIYGACLKLAIIMTLFVQMFRYAAEPFFFSHSTKENPQAVYANVMNFFIIVCSFIFLSVMLYIDVIKHFIGPDFRSGLGVVPILLMANLFLGIFYNLSIWYKLTSKTKWGAWLAIFGAVITLVFNFWLIPVMGYMGAAWTTLICYVSMTVLSYYIGQKHYKVPYNIVSFFYCIVISIAIWLTSIFIKDEFELSFKLSLLVNTMLLMVFIIVIWSLERRKNSYLRRIKIS